MITSALFLNVISLPRETKRNKWKASLINEEVGSDRRK
jgi:hypothetical protein